MWLVNIRRFLRFVLMLATTIVFHRFFGCAAKRTQRTLVVVRGQRYHRTRCGRKRKIVGDGLWRCRNIHRPVFSVVLHSATASLRVVPVALQALQTLHTLPAMSIFSPLCCNSILYSFLSVAAPPSHNTSGIQLGIDNPMKIY